jgi:phosphate transport system protein
MDKKEFSQHTSRRFNEELESIRSKVLGMGGLVEDMLLNALKALYEGDTDLAERVMKKDQEVNDIELSIDDDCRKILATRAPAAIDLRLIMAIIKAITDIERIGDEAEKIARTAIRLCSPNGQEQVKHHEIVTIADHVQRMVTRSLDAFARFDSVLAMEVYKSDEIVDHYYETIYRNSITYMMEDPKTISRRLNLMWIARSLERIGDHSKNICEYVVYTEKGLDIRHADDPIQSSQVS